MIHYQEPTVRALLFSGNFGLEKESLRVTGQGNLAHTDHPFTDPHIVRDFCENQTEINTDVHPDLNQTLSELDEHTKTIQKTLQQNHELLWPFSNPPIIRNEEDIPIARIPDPHARKYREYLSNRYGRYRMTFSGIHYNFSFDERLLERDYLYSVYLEQMREDPDPETKLRGYRIYKDHLYLDLAAKCSAYGWVLNALMSASPVCDGSFYEKSLAGSTCFTGMGSLRSSESGYWNFFTPVIDYTSIEDYVGSIRKYTNKKFLKEPRELYYPIRLKPAGVYSIDNLLKDGISHIELRMLDLNPMDRKGISDTDARFCHLFLVYLACMPELSLSSREQVIMAQNFKNAAHYDLKTIKIVDFNESSKTVYQAAMDFLKPMRRFYADTAPEYLEVIDYQIAKLEEPEQYRYAWKIRRLFETDYLKRGLELARYWQRAYVGDDF